MVHAAREDSPQGEVGGGKEIIFKKLADKVGPKKKSAATQEPLEP